MIIMFQKQDPSFYAKLIRFWTRSKYAHCEVVFSDGTGYSAQAGKGVIRFQAHPAMYPTSGWDAVLIETALPLEQNAESFCSEEVGCSYDWLGVILTQVFGLRRESKDKWFCSELCLAALHKMGKYTKFPAYKYSPGALYKLLQRG